MGVRITELDFITRSMKINSEQTAIAALRLEIESGHVAWESVVRLANQHLVAPTLWVSLRDKGLVDYLPRDLFEYLQELYDLNTQRNQHLKIQALEAIRALNANGIEPILLKGCGFLFDNTFGDLGARIMVDLDMLVLQQDLDACWQVLHHLGYRPKQSRFDYSNHHHRVPLSRRGAYGPIEVHKDLVRKGAAHILPTEVALLYVERLKIDDLMFGVLTPTYRLVHNILHSEFLYPSEREDATDILRSLNDLVVISKVYHDEVDWPGIRELMDAHGEGNMLHTYLYLAHRLLGMALPDWVKLTPARMAWYARARAELRYDWFARVNRRIERTIGALRFAG